jgi:hypothetical protein
MIKATGTIGDRKVLILGVTDGNLTQLKAGKPIHIFGAEIGIDTDVIIFHGRNEALLAKIFAPMVDKYTRVSDISEVKKN